MIDKSFAATPDGIPHGEALKAVIAPMIDGQKLLAVKTYYAYRGDNGEIDVGVENLSAAPPEGARRDALGGLR